MSAPDELLAEIDHATKLDRRTTQWAYLIDLLARCRTRIAANAALADDNARMKAKLRIMLGDPEVCNGTMVRDPETTYRYEPDCVRRKRENAALAARCEKAEKEYMPTMDEVYRFIKSNPITSASMLVDLFKLSAETSRCSNGRLRDLWRLAGGMVDKKQRAWIEVDLLPGLLRLLSEIPLTASAIPPDPTEPARELLGLPRRVSDARCENLCTALKDAADRCEMLAERISSNFQVPISSEQTDAVEAWRALASQAAGETKCG